MDDEVFRNKVRRAKRIIALSVAAVLAMLLAGCVLLGWLALRQKSTIGSLRDRIDEIHLLMEVNAEEKPAATPLPEPEKSLEYQELYPELTVDAPLLETPAEKTVYLTFDDGPSANTIELLDVLDEAGVKATFFVVGSQVDKYPDLLREIAARGHAVAVHSDSHDYQSIYQSVGSFLDDFASVVNKVESITGQTVTMVRLPGGSINGYNQEIHMALLAELLRRGYMYYDWNVSGEDATSKVLSASDIAASVEQQVLKHSYSIVLLHDHGSSKNMVEAMRQLIPRLKEQGYTFAALDATVEPTIFAYPAI